MKPHPHESPPIISAYVLAGGRSSRMGTDKSLLKLAGRPLIHHAVAKLRHLTPIVTILSSNPALTHYAPILPDIHPNTGPIGGLEAALTQTTTAWNLFLPIDMPFLPTAFLQAWLTQTLTQQSASATQASIHLIRTEDGRPQPGLCLLHRDILPALTQSIARSEYKLMQAFQSTNAQISITPIAHVTPTSLTPQQHAPQLLWFSNLNTPQDLAEAEAHLNSLDPL